MKYPALYSILLVVAFSANAQAPPLDLSFLNKIEAKAKNRTNITLDGQLLKLASHFFDSDEKDSAQLKTLVSNLKGIYVRGFEFDKDGQYTEADLEPLRAMLRRPPWSRIVDIHQGREASEIWVAQTAAGDKFSGVAIIDEEPLELTIVYISGLIGPEDVARLNGRFGINVDALESHIRPGNPKNDGGKKKENDR